MSGNRKKRGRPPRIDAAAKVAMLAALREGRRLDEVASGYGVTLQAFYAARRRDPLFAAAWRDAHALSAEAERRPYPHRRGEEIHIAANNRRMLQGRKMRHVRFDADRKGAFLAVFARSCDLGAAAAEGGVCERTVFNHIRSDPAFAAEFRRALKLGYLWLEAEAVRQRLEAQDRLRAAIEEAEEKGDPPPLAAAGVEFDRTMKLLARWRRPDGGLGPREASGSRERRMSFEEVIALIDQDLRALGLRRAPIRPREAGSS
jgi:hypothetical protein